MKQPYRIVVSKLEVREVMRAVAKKNLKKVGYTQFCKHGNKNNRYGTKKKLTRRKGSNNSPVSFFALNWRQYA